MTPLLRLGARALTESGRIIFILRRRLPVGPLGPLIDRLTDGCHALVMRLAAWLPATQRSTGGDAALSVHTLLCARDVPMYLWAIHSLDAAFHLPYRAVVHDDGSLSESDVALLGRHVPGVEILRRSEADAQAASVLADFPDVAEYRRQTVYGPKLADAHFSPRAPYTLLMDSDVLFFGRADEIEAAVQGGDPAIRYMADGHDYLRRPVLRETYPALPNGLNAGFLLFPTGSFPWAEMNEVCGWLLQRRTELDRTDDQIVYCIMTSRRPHRTFSTHYTAHGPDHPRRQELRCKHYHSSAKVFYSLEGLLHALRQPSRPSS